MQVETSPAWGESGRVRDLTLRRCVFKHCTHTPMWGEAVVQAKPELPGGEAAHRPVAFHDTLRVESCRFEGPAVQPLIAAWTRTVVFADNEMPSDWPPIRHTQGRAL